MKSARATLAVVLLVLFGLTSVGVSAAWASEADTIAAEVNQARASAGLPGLIRNPAMDSVALRWANQMGAANLMDHNPSYATQIPSGWTRAGENVATGQPTPSAMQAAWLDSTGHRANILGDYTDIGIAFVTVNGTTWGVQNFAKYPGRAAVAAPAPAPAAPAAPAPAPAAPAAPAPAPAAPAAAAAPAGTPPPSEAPSAAATAKANPADRAPRVTSALPTASPTPGSEPVLLSASTSRAPKPFPIGYVFGGILVALGIGGGIYGHRLRIRGRRRPRS
ncbi:MAG: CAP domain-containing protein [Actinomycetota bacterium]